MPDVRGRTGKVTMTSWPEAIAWAVIAVCALLAWVAWLKWGQRSDHTDTVLRGLQEPTWSVSAWAPDPNTPGTSTPVEWGNGDDLNRPRTTMSADE